MTHDSAITAAYLLFWCLMPVSVASAIAIPDLHNRKQGAEIARLIVEKEACHPGTRISIIENGRKTCLTEHKTTYGNAR